MRSNIPEIAIIVLLILMPGMSLAQRTDATFAGVITDSSGAVIPGAEVQIINEGTNATTQQLSNETGEFVFNFVPVGNYTLRIAMPGFKSYESKSIPLGAAQNVRRTYVLEVGAVGESVTVTGEASLVNAISPEQRNNLSTVEVNSLPMINRSIVKILDIAVGVAKDEYGQAGGAGMQRLRLNGLGGGAMSITADGTNGSMNGASPSSVSTYGGFNKIDIMSTEAISEVQIVKGVFPAEYGSSLGGNLSVITKSGTNDLHGSLFYRYEGSALSARQPFLNHERNSVWNQFGGSLGGPIKRDKAFFFAAFEGYRQRTSDPANARVATPYFRDIILKSLPAVETQIWLDFLPLPNQPHGPTDLLAEWVGPADRNYDDDHIDFKIDYFMLGGTLSLSGSLGHPYALKPTNLPKDPRIYHGKTERGSLNYVIGRSRWTASTRIGYNRNYEPRTPAFSLVKLPGGRTRKVSGQVGTISFPGMATPAGRIQYRGLTATYSFEQQFALFAGKHSWKFGGIFDPRSMGKMIHDPQNVSFQTLQDIQNHTPSEVTFRPGMNPSSYRLNNFGLFIQDDWRLSQKLVLNLGVRYEKFDHLYTKPMKEDQPACLCNRGPLLDAVTMQWGPLRDPLKPWNSDNFSLAPRFGFAYTLDDTGDFVMRGGFGIGFQYFDDDMMQETITTSPYIPDRLSFTRAEAAALRLKYPVYRDDLLPIVESRLSGQPLIGARFDVNFHPPYAMNYTLGFQRALTPSTVVDMGYVGTRGVKLTLNRPYNTPDRISGIRPNPSDISGTYIDGSQQSNYNSLQTSLKQRMTHGLVLNVNYTWGKGLGYTGGDTGQSYSGDYYAAIEDFEVVKIERGLNAGDITHNFIASWIYAVPTPFANSLVARSVLGGWQISGVWKSQTGQPIHISQTGGRPDLLDIKNAINKECCGFGNIQWLNPAAFELLPVVRASNRTPRRGNMNRSTLRSPGLYNLDLSLAKEFNVTEKLRSELKADLSNALNHTQYYYGGIQTNMSSLGFGRMTGAKPARSIQLQLRLSF